MNARYQVVVIHCASERFRDEVVGAVRETASGVLSHPGLLTFHPHVADVDMQSQAAVLYLGNTTAAGDRDTCEHVKAALRRRLPVLPVVRDTDPGDVADKLPSVIRKLHAEEWNKNQHKITSQLLTMLGLVEKERKVFISYVQKESAEMAIQLHGALEEARFDVFLDRVTLRPGDDFERHIEQNLSDKAFVVLIESQGVTMSQGVEHELLLAQTEAIEVLSITRPNVKSSHFVPAVDPAFRVRLECDDMIGGMLTDSKLQSVVTRIERTHAVALRRRREQTLGSITRHCDRNGWEWHPAGDWSLVVVGRQDQAGVLTLTPRTPRPWDLRMLHHTQCEARNASPRYAQASATLVHRARSMGHDERELLEWIAEPRELRMETLDDFLADGVAVS